MSDLTAHIQHSGFSAKNSMCQNRHPSISLMSEATEEFFAAFAVKNTKFRLTLCGENESLELSDELIEQLKGREDGDFWITFFKEPHWGGVTAQSRPQNRRDEWITSRQSVMSLLNQFNLNGPLQMSLSHSKGLVFVALSESFEPIGVDLEQGGRQISPALQKRLIAAEEKALLPGSFAPLGVWVAKEAAYKATPSAFQNTIGDYRICKIVPSQSPNADNVAWDLLIQKTSALEPLVLETRVCLIQGWWLAFAKRHGV